MKNPIITIIDNREVWEVKMNWYRNEQWESKVRVLYGRQ